jgi:two-component system, NtrC family, response regulator PilR
MQVEATPERRGTVLVVDDEEGVRESMRLILEDDCDILEARDGTRAIEVLRSHEIDIVLLDQRMPGEPGTTILPRIRALDPTIVVIVATGVRDVQTAVEAMRLGAYDYVVKPFDVDDVRRLVQRALEKRVLERQVLRLRSALEGNGFDAGDHTFHGMVGRHPEMARATSSLPVPSTSAAPGRVSRSSP